MADVKTHDTKRSETQLIGEARLAHCYHHEKRTKSAGGALLDKPHHSTVVMLPKLGPAETCPNYAKLAGMAMEAATKAWNGWPEGGNWPVQDGDIPFPHKPKPGEKALTAEQLAERNKWRVGYWCVEATNYIKEGPKVSVLIDGVLQDIPAQTVAGVQLYKSGDFGYVSMNSYTFHSEKGKWGVNFGYEGVAYTRPGDLIGGGPKSTAQMFAGIPIATGAPGRPVLPTSGGAPVSSGHASIAPPPAAPSAPVLPTAASSALAMPGSMPTMTYPSSAAPPPPLPPGLPRPPGM